MNDFKRAISNESGTLVFTMFFLLFSYLLIFLGIYKIPSNDASVVKVFFIFSVVLFFCSNIFIFSFMKKISTILLALSITLMPVLIIISNFESIKNSSIKYDYNILSTDILNGNQDVSNSIIYKDFLENKKTNNLEKLIEYRNNIDNYSSISSEQLMNLKILINSTKNNVIKNKIIDMFSDGIVTKHEYKNFKNFILNSEIHKQDEIASLLLK